MKNKVFLSICIPTYNMGIYLTDLIKSVNNQLDGINKNIEICISDNASTDNTEAVVTSLQEKYTNITYKKNKQNIGADNNFLNVVDMASGEYCWFMGADDIISESILSEIIETIKQKPNVDIFLGDRKNSSAEGISLNEEYWHPKKSLITKNNLSKYIEDSYKIGAIFAFISSIIFKKVSWDKSKKQIDIEKFIGTAYIHSVILLNIFKNNGSLLYLHKVIVVATRDNDSFLNKGYLNRIKIDYNYLPIFEYLYGLKSEEYKMMKALLKKERTLAHFLKAKASEKDSKEVVNFMKKHKLNNIYLVRLFPTFFIKLLIIFHKFINFRRY